jgi:NAD(P)-dependent dehydrogenase (short-subunit alcohol dehydrogenase family)
MDLGMKDKEAFVTGGESGIGRACAVMFAEEGANVVIAGIGETLGKETVELITAAGGNCIFVKADVRNPSELKAAVATAVEKLGRLDYSVNSAMKSSIRRASSRNTSPAHVNRMRPLVRLIAVH